MKGVLTLTPKEDDNCNWTNRHLKYYIYKDKHIYIYIYLWKTVVGLN
jgi:hypothetical protein